MYLKTTRWLKEFDNLEKPTFVKLVEPALAEINKTDIEKLLANSDWRHQTVGSWFAGVKGWSQYTEKIGSFLGMPFREVSVCFALACFKNETAVNLLCEYLNKSIDINNIEYVLNNKIELSTLIFVNQERSVKYLQELHIDNKKEFIEDSNQIFQKMIVFKNKWFK